MTDQGDEHSDEQGNEEPTVMIPQKVFNEVLDRLDELEEENVKLKGGEAQKREDEDDAERLAREASQRGDGKKQLSFDDMTNTQLVNHMFNIINDKVSTPILTELEGLKMMREEDSLRRQDAFKDFDEYRDRIYDLAAEHPKLNLKQCYKMARDELAEQGETKSSKKDTRLSKELRSIPLIQSEKPGAPSSGMRAPTPGTRRKAAEQAFDEVFSGDKE